MSCGSSAAKDEPNWLGIPSSFLGVTGCPAGSVNQGNHLADSLIESSAIMHAMASVSEGVCWQQKYSLLVHVFTARDRWALEPHAWVEDLLNDFFQSMLGINMSVTLLSLAECLIFCGSHSQGQGMSYNESLWYAHQLMGVHQWTGYTVDAVALQCTLKEAQHVMQAAQEFTHARTKQYIAHLKVITPSLTQQFCLTILPGAWNDTLG